MAYKEFHYEKYYEAPDYSKFLDASTQAVSNMFQSIAAQHQQKAKNADQFNFDLSEGKFENDQKVLTEYANNVVNRGKQEIVNSGKTSNETHSMMGKGKSYQQMSQIQFEKAKSLQAEILARDTKDPYYDGQIDLGKLKSAVNGDDNEVNFLTRGDRMSQAEKSLGGIDSFKYTDYRADYVKKIGSQEKARITGNPNATKTIIDEATFWDDSAKPGVTDKHAIDYLKSDPQGRVDALFNKKIDDQITSEIDKMKASGDTRVSWMKDKTKEEIKNELINDPSKNIINSDDFGVRKRNMAKSDLQEADRINSKVSVEYKADKDTSGGLYKNPNVVHSYSFNDSKMQATAPGEQTSPHSNPGPGGVIMQKDGKPLSFNSTNPVRTNINTGVTNKSKIGSVPFNLTGYQMQAFKQTGAPFLLLGSNTDEIVGFINRMPLENFDPNGKLKLQPELKVALQGYTVNQANVLNAANNQERTLQGQIADAQNANDSDKVAILERNLSKIQGIKSLVGSGVDDQELALSASRAGIRGIQVNEIVQASDTDLANIKAITQGLDLKNPEYHNDDMRRVQDAYKARYQQAVSAGYKPEVGKPAAKSKAKTKPTTKPKEIKTTGTVDIGLEF